MLHVKFAKGTCKHHGKLCVNTSPFPY